MNNKKLSSKAERKHYEYELESKDKRRHEGRS